MHDTHSHSPRHSSQRPRIRWIIRAAHGTKAHTVPLRNIYCVYWAARVSREFLRRVFVRRYPHTKRVFWWHTHALRHETLITLMALRIMAFIGNWQEKRCDMRGFSKWERCQQYVQYVLHNQILLWLINYFNISALVRLRNRVVASFNRSGWIYGTYCYFSFMWNYNDDILWYIYWNKIRD